MYNDIRPAVAIVGRPNVGKSTLFNALLRERLSIEAPTSGVTRDRVLHPLTLDDIGIDLVDTGGIGIVDRQNLADAVDQQIDAAISAASLLVFLVDAREGITPHDQEIAARLRKTRRPVIMVANKADANSLEVALPSFHALGFGDTLAVSAKHRRNLGDLEDLIVAKLIEILTPEELENAKESARREAGEDFHSDNLEFGEDTYYSDPTVNAKLAKHSTSKKDKTDAAENLSNDDFDADADFFLDDDFDEDDEIYDQESDEYYDDDSDDLDADEHELEDDSAAEDLELLDGINEDESFATEPESLTDNSRDEPDASQLRRIFKAKRRSPLKLAIVGRRNVGKSSLTNLLCGYDRVIVSNVPGTTRDAVDVLITPEKGEPYIVIDTAGLRKRGQMDDIIEFFGHIRTERAIRRADVVLLLFDSTDEISRVDKRIVALLDELNKPAILVLNKWDLVQEAKPGLTVEDYQKYLNDQLPAAWWRPLAGISAKSGQGVSEMMQLVWQIDRQAETHAGTGSLNAAIAAAKRKRRPKPLGGKIGKIYYATQVAVRPPTFIIYCNNPALFDNAYIRYLQNQLRTALDCPDIPVRLLFRTSKEREVGRYQ